MYTLVIINNFPSCYCTNSCRVLDKRTKYKSVQSINAANFWLSITNNTFCTDDSQHYIRWKQRINKSAAIKQPFNTPVLSSFLHDNNKTAELVLKIKTKTINILRN